MARDCTICNHPDRQVIEQRIITGTPIRKIADEFEVGRESVSRHKHNHLPAEMVKSKRFAEVAAADELLERVEGLFDEASELLRMAKADGKYSAATSAIKEARSSLELIARITGDLKTGTVINLTYSPQWVQLRQILVDTLEPHPEIKADVIQALEEAERHEILDG